MLYNEIELIREQTLNMTLQILRRSRSRKINKVNVILFVVDETKQLYKFPNAIFQ